MATEKVVEEKKVMDLEQHFKDNVNQEVDLSKKLKFKFTKPFGFMKAGDVLDNQNQINFDYYNSTGCIEEVK